MKKICSAALLALAASASAFDPEQGFGVGFVLGSPSGLSASLPLGSSKAINAVVGYDLTREANLHVRTDYVWHQHGLIQVEHGKVSLYYGPGAFVRIGDAAGLGILGVGGVDYRFPEMPLQAFLEIGLGINVLPDTRSAGGGGIGLRYYF